MTGDSRRWIDLVDRIDAVFNRDDGTVDVGNIDNGCHTLALLGLDTCPPRKGSPWYTFSWSRGADAPFPYVLHPPGERELVISRILGRFADWDAFRVYAFERSEANDCIQIRTQADIDACCARPARHLRVASDEPLSLEMPALTKPQAIVLDGPVTLHAPNLTEVASFAQLFKATLVAPKLQRVGDQLFLRRSSRMHAPALAEVGGSLFVQASKLLAPTLARVGGQLDVTATTKLPSLVRIGTLGIEGKGKGKTLRYESIERIDGDVQISGSCIVDMPALKEIGGELRVWSHGERKADLIAPQLCCVGGRAWPRRE